MPSDLPQTSSPTNDSDQHHQPYSRSISEAWYERACAVIPGGIYGHQSPVLTIPGSFPYFARESSGARFTDVDGNQYIDYLCGYGPLILGAQHPEVEDATRQQVGKGDCFNLPTEHMVQLAERLTDWIDVADWALFAKNGADTTRWAIRVAREATGKKTILRVQQAYHGTDSWSSDALAGVIQEDRQHVRTFPWNDPSTLMRTAKRAPGGIAAIIVTPYHHPAYADSSFASDAFRQTIHEIKEATDCLLILDDIRAGFRLHLGGSHRITGWHPDILCFSKAIANGYPLSACVGTGALKAAASRVFTTGSFWMNAVPMVAALKTLEILQREDAVNKLKAAGQQLIDGMTSIGAAHGIKLIASGPPAIPWIRVDEDPSFRQQQRLCSAALQKGLFLHPHHNWFLSLAHTPDVIAESLERFDQACKTYTATR